jgi:hypothetical protein
LQRFFVKHAVLLLVMFVPACSTACDRVSLVPPPAATQAWIVVPTKDSATRTAAAAQPKPLPTIVAGGLWCRSVDEVVVRGFEAGLTGPGFSLGKAGAVSLESEDAYWNAVAVEVLGADPGTMAVWVTTLSPTGGNLHGVAFAADDVTAALASFPKLRDSSAIHDLQGGVTAAKECLELQ